MSKLCLRCRIKLKHNLFCFKCQEVIKNLNKTSIQELLECLNFISKDENQPFVEADKHSCLIEFLNGFHELNTRLLIAYDGVNDKYIITMNISAAGDSGAANKHQIFKVEKESINNKMILQIILEHLDLFMNGLKPTQFQYETKIGGI